MLQAASGSQRGINFRLKPCVSCHCRLLLPFSPAVTMCQWITMGRGTMPRVGIIKTSKVYVVRSQTTTRKMGAPLLPSNVRETKIEAGLSGAFGQTEHRFPLRKVPLGAGEEREIHNYPSLIKGNHFWLTEVCYLWNIQTLSVTHSADKSLNHWPPNCTSHQHLVTLGPFTCSAAVATALKTWVSVTILIWAYS